MQAETESKFGFPVIKAEDTEIIDFIGFNYAKSSKADDNKGIHFFLDDYQFTRIWRDPLKYIPILKKYGCALSPDFSLYCDMPMVMQMYNHYRRQWFGAFMQANCICTIPTVCWSNVNSFEWCFCGIPRNSTIAVSSTGTQKSKETKVKFLKGYMKMLEVLEPTKIIFFDDVPQECEGNIVHIENFTHKFRNGGK